jgi:hypothetical protein
MDTSNDRVPGSPSEQLQLLKPKLLAAALNIQGTPKSGDSSLNIK